MKSIRVVSALKEETVSMDLNDLSAKANIRRGTLLNDEEREKIEETVSASTQHLRHNETIFITLG